MESSTESIKLLREKLGESISEGGDETETFFSDTQLTDILARSATMDHAILDGWETKVAQWANLVNVVDGASSRAFSDLMENGEKMIARYRARVDQASNLQTRTRIGNIKRRR